MKIHPKNAKQANKKGTHHVEKFANLRLFRGKNTQAKRVGKYINKLNITKPISPTINHIKWNV